MDSNFVFRLRAQVDAPLIVGESSHGLRRIVPITGGSFEGPRIRGRILPGGADWQFVRPDGVLELEARYTLETDDGALIMVISRGIRRGPAEVMQRLAQGATVDASEYYFRTGLTLEAPAASAHAWLNQSLFIGIGSREARAAIIELFEIQ
ncbi:MAG: DUF3237 domain-containing protein [Steroidobacteraceae bacterium]